MNGPVQWTPGGFVQAMTSKSTGAQAPVVAQPLDHDDSDDDDAPIENARSVVARPAAVTKKKPAASMTPKNVVKLARARLREIDVEIRRLKKLEVEREELRRLLDAATSRPRGVVRELKRPAG